MLAVLNQEARMKTFLLVLLVLFGVAAFLQVEFYFTVVYLLFVLVLLSKLWAQRTTEALQVERRFVGRAFQGDHVEVALTLRNPSGLPLPWVEINELLPVQLLNPPFYRRVFSLGRHETRHFDYTLLCRRRGYYPLGPLQIRTGDLFGLHGNQLTSAAPDHLIVYPRIVPLQQLGLPTRSPLAALPARSPLFEDPSHVVGLRGYQRGDSPRRIHWTATASSGQLLVKQYQPAIARETLICLDLNEEQYEHGVRFSATELAIVVAASLASHIVGREGLPVGLAMAGWDPLRGEPMPGALAPRRERAHLMALLEQLARVQLAAGLPFAEIVRRESVKLSWGSTIAVITGKESDALLDTLLYLKRASFAVALILVQSSYPSAALKQRAALLRLPLYHVWDEQDIEGWRSE